MTNKEIFMKNWVEGTLLAKEGPMWAKKLSNLVAICDRSEQIPELSFMLLKCCSDSFLEIISSVTDQVFLRSELTVTTLTWKYFFLAILILIVPISILVISRFVGFSRICLELFIKRILPVTGYKKTFRKPGFWRTSWFMVYRFKWKWLKWYAEIRN